MKYQDRHIQTASVPAEINVDGFVEWTITSASSHFMAVKPLNQIEKNSTPPYQNIVFQVDLVAVINPAHFEQHRFYRDH